MAITDDILGAGKLADIELPDRYRVLRHIADGGMASVFSAHDSLLSRKVAIKVLAPQFQHDFRAMRRFAREARAAARVSGHRNIVTIYDVGGARGAKDPASPGAAFIVMEHLAGGTVADAVRTGATSPQAAASWIREAAAALDYAHAHGVVHGDIKPANLLLDSRRDVHIGDFGIARIASDGDITSTGQLFGTAAYISPEQALGSPATEASDRYALAVVAFELLTGEKPFSAEGFIGIARRHVDEQPPAASARNQALPRMLDRVLERGLAKQPEERWSSAGAFADAIEAALAQRRVAFAQPPRRVAAADTSAPVSRHQGRRPWLGAVAALATLALLTGAAVGASQDGSGSRPASASHAGLASRAAARPAQAQAKKAPAKAPAQTAGAPQTTAPAAPRTQPTTAATPTQPPQSASAAALEAQGHNMMLQGNYAGAVPVLQQAMHAASPGSLLYQYSLFDLAHSYREMGDLVAAIPLLQERLQYNNQRPVVQQELNTALALYNHQTGSGRAAPGPGAQHGQGQGHGPGKDQGAGHHHD